MKPYEMTMSAPQNPSTADYLRISQTAATAHLRALGLEGKLEQQGYVWVIVRISGKIYAPLPETFTVQTWPGVRHRGFLPRYCRLLKDGAVLADMVTVWVLADAKSRTMALDIDPGVPELVTGDELPTPRSLPKKAVTDGREFAVEDGWIDANGHMNNCFYPYCAERTLGLTGLPKAFQVDYRHELLPGQRAAVAALWEENTVFISGFAEKEHFRMKLEY